MPSVANAAGMWGSSKAYSGGLSEYILGYDTDDLGLSTNLLDQYRGNTVTTDGTGGQITKLCIRVAAVDGTNDDVKIGLYEDGVSGHESQTLLAEVEILAIAVGVNCADVIGGPTLTAATDYNVVATFNGGGSTVENDTKSGWTRWKSTSGVAYVDAMANPGPATSGTSDDALGMWGVYEH